MHLTHKHYCNFHILIYVSGLCGIPENLIQALLDGGKKDLTIVSNNAGERLNYGDLMVKESLQEETFSQVSTILDLEFS